MTACTFVRSASALALALGLSSCLPTGKVDPTPDKCSCSGILCLNGEVSRRTPAPDNGEGDNPCLTCNYDRLGTCATECTTETLNVPGCPVAYACETWSRAAAGKNCAIDRDCEPGVLEGKPYNKLACRQNVCTDVGDEKFKDVAVKSCQTKTFGASAWCDGRACMGEDEYAKTYVCSAARCIENSDCPTGWHCQCAEEYTNDGLNGWRWCMPDVAAAADAGQ